MIRHYVLYDVSKDEVIAFLQAYKRFGYLNSASLAYHTPENGEPHFHVVADYPRGAIKKDPFRDFKGCVMVDDIRCDESTWRDYLSQNGKTPIIDIR